MGQLAGGDAGGGQAGGAGRVQAGGKGCVWQLWVSMATILFPPPEKCPATQLLEPPVRAGGQIRVVQTGQAPGAGGEAGELGALGAG